MSRRIQVPDELIAQVAKAHGTKVATDYFNVTRDHVIGIRRKFENYQRGRGRPTRAEAALVPPRLDCACPRCVEWRAEEMRVSNIRHGQLFNERTLLAVGSLTDPWRKDAACKDEDLAIWFPTMTQGPQGAKWRPARIICGGCPVREECAEWALANDIPDGMYGGLTPKERTRILATGRQEPRAA